MAKCEYVELQIVWELREVFVMFVAPDGEVTE
jgi:hypothetical protein